MASPHNDFLSPKAAAQIIGKSDDWLERMRKRNGEGPPWYRIGDRIFYPKSSLLEWLETCRCK